jgi:hypothetical protein
MNIFGSPGSPGEKEILILFYADFVDAESCNFIKEINGHVKAKTLQTHISRNITEI